VTKNDSFYNKVKCILQQFFLAKTESDIAFALIIACITMLFPEKLFPDDASLIVVLFLQPKPRWAFTSN